MDEKKNRDKGGGQKNPTNIPVRTNLCGLSLSGDRERKNICQFCDPYCCRGGTRRDGVVYGPALEHLCLPCMVTVK
ncbi:uncharacterized [Lates japonicus]